MTAAIIYSVLPHASESGSTAPPEPSIRSSGSSTAGGNIVSAAYTAKYSVGAQPSSTSGKVSSESAYLRAASVLLILSRRAARTS